MSTPELMRPVDAVEQHIAGVIKRDESGKVTNRNTAYDIVSRLPNECKVRIGHSLYVHIPSFRQWIASGGNREAA